MPDSPTSPVATRLLLAEDDDDIRAVAGMALELAGAFEICSCASGAAALAAAPGFAPHVLLLDVMMPGLDGPTTLARIRQLPGLAEVPAIFLTAKAMGDEVAELRRLGALGVIIKPFDPMTLGAEIQRLVAVGRGG